MTMWTLPRIDDGLTVIGAKYDEALAKGDLVSAVIHEARMDRLLEMRKVAT